MIHPNSERQYRNLLIPFVCVIAAAPIAFADAFPATDIRFPLDGVPQFQARYGQDIEYLDDVIVIGASGDDDLDEDAGAVYVYRKSGGSWSLDAKLFASDADIYDEFGAAVSYSNDRIVVIAQANGSASGTGSVYTFEYDGANWSEVNKFDVGGGGAFTAISNELSLSGDSLVVSIDFENLLMPPHSSGAILYRWNGSSWDTEHVVSGLPGGGGPQVELRQDVALIGAATNDDIGNDAGVVYVYRRSAGGAWTNEASLYGDNTIQEELFGFTVDLNEDASTCIVGTKADDVHRKAYIFRNSGTSWSLEAELLAGPESYAGKNAAFDEFGAEVTIHNDIAVVTDISVDNRFRKGVIYCYAMDAGAWPLRGSHSINEGDLDEAFGKRIEVQGNHVLVANLRGDFSFPGAPGAAFLIDLCGPDLNADGVVNSGDLGVFITAFGSTTNPETDFNNDGVTDTADLGYMISAFGQSCL